VVVTQIVINVNHII